MSVIVLRKMFSFDELFIALTDLHHNDFWNLSSDLSKALKHLSLTYHELTARLTWAMTMSTVGGEKAARWDPKRPV